jgi:transposase InsO family protein
MKNHCYWEGMAQETEDYIRCCAICIQSTGKANPRAYRLILPKHAFHTVSLDVVGPIGSAPTNRGNRYIIVAVDHLTKWVEARAVSSFSSSQTAKFVLEDIIARHGCPQAILTDNATNFVQKTLPKLNLLMSIRSALTTPYHPESNGMVERANGTLVKIIKRLAAKEPSDWDEYLVSALIAYRVSVHSTTKISPFRMLYGHEPGLPLTLASINMENNAPRSYEAHLFKLTHKIMEIQTKAFHSLANTSIDRFKYFTAQRKPLEQYNIGDKVFLYP